MVLPYEYVVYCILLLAAWDTDGVVHECAESKCVQNGQSTKFVCIAEHETIQWYAEDNRWVATNDTVYVPDEYNATITDDPDPSRSEFSKVYTLTIKNPTEAQHNAKTVNCAAVGEDTSCHAVPFYVVSKATDIPNIVRQSMICEVDNITFTFSASTAEKIRPRLHFHFYVDGKEAPSCNIPNTTDPDCSVSSITSRSCDFRDDCPVGKMVTASIKYSHLSLGTKEGDRIECNSTVVQRLGDDSGWSKTVWIAIAITACLIVVILCVALAFSCGCNKIKKKPQKGNSDPILLEGINRDEIAPCGLDDHGDTEETSSQTDLKCKTQHDDDKAKTALVHTVPQDHDDTDETSNLTDHNYSEGGDISDTDDDRAKTGVVLIHPSIQTQDQVVKMNGIIPLQAKTEVHVV